MTATVHARRVGLQKAERGREIQRPPPPATLTLIVAWAPPPAMRTAILLAGSRPDRHDQHLVGVVELDLLDHRSAQPEQLLPYPERAHVATVPLLSVPTVRSRNRRRTAACAPPARRSGASNAPTSLPQSADGGGCQAAPTPSRTAKTSREQRPSSHALVDQTTTAALPRDRVHLTHGTCRGAVNAPPVASARLTVI